MEHLTPPSIVSHVSAMNPKTPQNHNHVLARLQRDLDSPSAATRLRAMRALKSPMNCPYNQFDVPHEEQDIITEEERQEYVPQTIQDVMKDVIVYVEVRFGDENRTASIKEAMVEIGATVNDNFNKNTTHVIFSNGTQSTYNKAKQLNIPIVSILWIEACKKQLRLVDPSKFAIHNIAQYENPELYKKVKVKKFFQTENELKIRKKKITPPPIKFKPIKVPKKAKDNLTGMMNEFQSRQIVNSNGINYFSSDFNVVDLFDDSEVTDGKAKQVNSKRSLVFDDEVTVSPPLRSDKQKTGTNNKQSTDSDVSLVKSQKSPPVFKTPLNRRTTVAPSASAEQTPNSLVRVTRRTSMLALSSPSIDHMSVERNRHVMPEEITEITNSNDNRTNNHSVPMDITPNVASSTRIISSRKTMFSSSAMNLTEVQPTVQSTRKRNSITPARFKDFEVNTKKYLGKNSPENSQSEKSNRRRTVFASGDTIPSQSTVAIFNGAKDATEKSSNRRRTVNTLKQSTDVDASRLNTLHQRKDTTVNQSNTTFAPNDASSPLVVNKDNGRNIASLRRTLFKTVPSPLAATPTAKVNETKPTNSKRRRTLLPPSDITSSALAVTPSQGNSNPNVSNRRRTCFSTSQSASHPPSFASEDKHINGLTTVLTPPTKTAELENNLSKNCLTPQGHTLFEEYSKRLSFSSTNKRHTDRDISLFIIEQRLKNLNEIARLNRSVNESEPNVDNIEKRVADGVARSSPQLQIPDTAKRVQDVQDVQPPPSKKRKLFNPTAYEEQVAMQCNDPSDNNNKATSDSGDKLPTQTTKIPSLASHKKTTTKQRRSTMDFKSGPPKPVNVYASIMKSNAPLNYLAYSNMNPEQVNVINKAIATLGKFKVEPNVTKKTTHLVTFDSKRTQKVLRAIIRGLWIINYDWVTSSLEAGTWLYEEPFENRTVSSAVSMCRAESQAFGSKYKIEIFGHIEPIYISSQCRCPALKELYTMCGGRVTNSRQTAKYIVTDKFKDKVSQRCVHSDWILDSIAAANCKTLSSYVLKSVP
ncbi:hypothetical protein HA402_000691 [Bradysia odoriphaga]|nr:hypothetical protein HA402_000691 [Bradysia odoriphaga]